MDEEESTFTVYRDDHQMEVVDTISLKLKVFGLTINKLEGGDDWQEYEIVKINL